jgi:ankyrin repeat protein
MAGIPARSPSYSSQIFELEYDQSTDSVSTGSYYLPLTNAMSPFLEIDPSISGINIPVPGQDGQDSLALVYKNIDREACSLSADIIGKNSNLDSAEYISEISGHLNDILIERAEGDLIRNTRNLLSPSLLNASLQLLRYSIYLSSNNLLTSKHTDKLLLWITRYKKFNLMEHLIGMKTLTTNIFASNLLASAARLQDTNAINALIALGVDINGVTTDDKTALYEATNIRHLVLVQILLKAGADPNVYYHLWYSPLKAAMRGENNKSLVNVLLRAGASVKPVQHSNGSAWIPLCDAVVFQDPEVVQLLLDAGADVNYREYSPAESSKTLLQTAARLRSLEVLQMLLGKGADVDALDARGYGRAAPIQYAAHTDNTEMVQMLLEWEAGPDGHFQANMEDDDSEDDSEDCDHPFCRTPLQMAVKNQNAVMVRLLIREGARVNGFGWRPAPLAIAATANNGHLIKLLLSKGADPNVDSGKGNGHTVLQRVIFSSNSDIPANFGDKRANTSPCQDKESAFLRAGAEVRTCNLVQLLLDAGARVNAAPAIRKGRTAL